MLLAHVQHANKDCSTAIPSTSSPHTGILLRKSFPPAGGGAPGPTAFGLWGEEKKVGKPVLVSSWQSEAVAGDVAPRVNTAVREILYVLS